MTYSNGKLSPDGVHLVVVLLSTSEYVRFFHLLSKIVNKKIHFVEMKQFVISTILLAGFFLYSVDALQFTDCGKYKN